MLLNINIFLLISGSISHVRGRRQTGFVTVNGICPLRGEGVAQSPLSKGKTSQILQCSLCQRKINKKMQEQNSKTNLILFCTYLIVEGGGQLRGGGVQ